MKVLHVITGLSDGGAEAALFRFCTYDTMNGHEVISLMDAGKYGPLLEAHGVVVTSLGMPRGRITLLGIWRLWRLIRDAHPDVLQTWMYHANLLGGIIGRVAGVRNICWGIHHSDLASPGTARSTVAVARICAWLSSHVPRKVVYCGHKAARVHATFGYDSGRECVIPNGYDLSVFRPDPVAGESLRAELRLARDKEVIGFVARFDPLKDHTNLLQALALLKQRGRVPVCLLVGAGMDADNVELLARIAALGLKDQVRLLGRRNDIPAVMNALDLHVMSSRSEAFPNVLAEAMACGTPCVTTDVGDAADIVGDTGWVVVPNNAVALAEGIETALSHHADEGNWQLRQWAAREHIKNNFSIDRMLGRYASAWCA